MTAYYNEIDPAAADVLRELIARDVIAPGDVDDRSIKEISPDELSGYTQCHFFAGGGLWSVAARLAGWPDERELWTGSCPCQPFSAAGKQLGTDDPRHLWPDFHRLIRARRPAVVMGEQVAGAAGYGWFDGVRADLAGEDYSGRAVDIPVCAIDGPHQRNRLYWTAVDNRLGARLEGLGGHVAGAAQGWSIQGGPPPAADDLVFSDAQGERRREGRPEHELWSGRHAAADADVCLQPHAGRELRGSRPGIEEDRQISSNANGRNGSWWADYEWIVSPLDDKARRAKSGIPFLVDGLPGRMDLWRVGGNAISPVLAAEVIAAFLDAENGLTFIPHVREADHG
jgi:DNA (cytosine-5)-methyltransferase 1